LAKPSAKAMEMNQRDSRVPKDAAKRTTKRTRRASSTDTDFEPTIYVRSETAGANSERALLGRVLEELKDLKEELKDFKEESIKQQELICKLEREIVNTKEQLKQVVTQLEATTRTTIPSPSPAHGQASYADVARTPPDSLPSNIRTLSSGFTTPSNSSESLFCTIDVSSVGVEERSRVTPGEIRAAVEREVREEKESPAWRCRAVTQELKASHRIRIVCRDEAEHLMIKRIVEKRLPRSVRVLRDEYYPIKVDGVSRSAVLDELGKELPGLNDMLNGENATEVVKVGWLSDRLLKEHGSMVVYLKKATEAARFLREGYFYAGGLSGQTSAFQRRQRPNQCYNCQELANHKAFQCKKPQVCGRCAQEGHHHSACTEAVPKCALCGGPHESFSKTCRRLYPSRNE
jgi:hypothetical protein